MKLSLDYETFSTVDLRQCGLWAYARSPSTDALCLGYRIDAGPWRVWAPHLVKRPPADLVGAMLKATCHAWNAPFEYAITKHVGRRYGLPLPPPRMWRDSMIVGRMCGMPGALGACADALQVDNRKDKDGARLLKLFSIPQRDGRRVLPQHQPAEFAKLMAYCVQDVRTEQDVLAALPVQELPPEEQRVWEADLLINERGCRVNVPMVKGAIGIIGRAKTIGAARLSHLTGGLVTSPSQQKRILAYCASKGYIPASLPKGVKKGGVKVASLNKVSVADALADQECPKAVRALLELRDALNVSSVAKYLRMMQALSDGRICGVHAMNAADTGRWGGRITQFQNLPRPLQKLDAIVHGLIARGKDGLLEAWGEPLIVLRDALRNTIIPSTGNKLVIVDKSSIEARVLGWVSGCKGYMRAYRDGLDLYIVTGAEVFKLSYDAVLEKYKLEEAGGEECLERLLGKKSVLGLGYGMGVDTFEDTCNKDGLVVARGLLERAVKTYRSVYPEIPAYWKDIEHAAVETIRTGEARTVGVVRMAMVAGYFTIRLPSGRKLWYPSARVDMATDRYGRKKWQIRFRTALGPNWVWTHTYGGRLVENIVQAIARDLLATALVKLERQGHRPVLHVHDEVVCDTPTPERTLEAVKHAFTTDAPAWAAGLPLGCKGAIAEFYRK